MDFPKRYQEYLDFIRKYPKYLGNKGDWRDGEIEVISDPSLFEECEKGAAKIMMAAGVPEEDVIKRGLVGVYDENRWGVSIHEPLRLPDGSYTTFNRWISWGALESGFAGVVVVPQTSDGRYIFLKNYRNATKNWCVEFPRGGKDPGNSLLRTLKNELSEEMGATIVEDPRKVGEVFPDSGVLSSRVEIFIVKVRISGLAKHEATEAIRGLLFMPKDRVRDMVKNQCYTDEDGKIYEFKDGFTLSALAILDS